MARDPYQALEQALAEVLRERRMKHGLSQEQLAEDADLHPTYISMLERVKRTPTTTTLHRIALALNTRASALLAAAETKVARKD